jgi:hypothetical protein
MSINASIACGISGTRELTTGVDNSSRPAFRFAVGATTSANANSTPDGEAGCFPQVALVAGAYTIDLTALPDVNGATTTLTGKKVRALFFENLGAANMTFAKGASNGLDTLSGAWTMTLLPGEKRCIDLMGVDVASIAAISGTIKTIDVTGTGTDTFDFGVVVG